jgi:hypothetical protein
MKMRTLLLLLAAAFLWLAAPPSPVAADSPVALIASSVNISFPTHVEFTLEAESSTDITDVRLCYHVNKTNYAKVVSEGWADFSPGKRVKAMWTWDMRDGSLPPGAALTYWWTITDSAGGKVDTPAETIRFLDDRYEWRSLTATVPLEGEQASAGTQLTIFWYQGDESFGAELMASCEEGLTRLVEDIGALPEKHIDIYVYASTVDLQGAMVFSQEWTGGVAFAPFSIIAISIPPTRLDWGKRALIHELTHLVVHQATSSPYAQLPTWLDEGIAMYNEGKLDPFLDSYLQRAIAENSLISLRTLCSPFSAEPQKAYLSYAESYSVVEYLVTNYGRERMLHLLALLNEGCPYDDAFFQVYGFDLGTLDARWRATLLTGTIFTPPRQAEVRAWYYHPALIAVIAALATVLTLWGALSVEERSWARRGKRG